MKTSFSGHEKFECKISWLPLAYKDIQAIYNDIESSIAITGLGSNKVKSLKQWLNKLTLLEDNTFSEQAEILFSNDPYLENSDSLWILHTYLSQNLNKATLYSLFFNEFFIFNFSKEALLDKTKQWCENNNIKISANTLESDVSVLIKMYLKSNTRKEFSNGLFCELNLLHKVNNEYVFNIKNPAELSDTAFFYIFLYFIRGYKETTISVKDLQIGNTSLRQTLALTEEKLLEKLEKLEQLSEGDITYREAAGIKEIYLQNRPNLNDVLKRVYTSGSKH